MIKNLIAFLIFCIFCAYLIWAALHTFITDVPRDPRYVRPSFSSTYIVTDN